MKAVLRFGYLNFVLEAEDALQILTILDEKAERYEEKFRRDAEGEDAYYTHHVWKHDDKTPDLSLMSESLYRIGKLAGKPTND